MKTEQEWLEERIKQFEAVQALNHVIQISKETIIVTDTIIKVLKLRLEELKGVDNK